MRNRFRSVYTKSETARRPTTGWTGAHQLSAPDVPTSATTAWLHTGHPTARNDTKPPHTVVRSCASTAYEFTSGRIAKIRPIRNAVTAKIR